MNSSIKSLIRLEMIEAIAIVAMGFLLAMFPSFWASFLSVLLSIVITVIGLILVANCIIEYGGNGIKSSKFVFGVILTALGIFLLCNFTIPISIFAVAIGIIILLFAINKVTEALKLKAQNEKYLFKLTDGIINTIFGLIVLIRPFFSVEILITVLGLYLIYVGCLFFVMIVKSKFTIK